jgi:hypothetical protein
VLKAQKGGVCCGDLSKKVLKTHLRMFLPMLI